MSWVELQPDGKHRVFRCASCRRFGITGKGEFMPAPGAEALGDCICRTSSAPRVDKGTRR